MNWGDEKLKKIRDMDTHYFESMLNPTLRVYRPDSNYPSFPTLSKKKRLETPYFERVECLKEAVDKEFLNDRGVSQFDRDGKLWRLTLRFTGNRHRRDILRRIFTTLRWGGLLIIDRSNTEGISYKFWRETGWPIASAISHGSRVMFQLPQLKDESGESYRDHGFWNWLVSIRTSL